MRRTSLNSISAILLMSSVALAFSRPAAAQGDALPSWNDGPSKQAIVSFVGKVTKQGSPDFVPTPEHIATFDNDGCLWAVGRTGTITMTSTLNPACR